MKSGEFNRLYRAGVPVVANPPTTNAQFSGANGVASGSSARAVGTTLSDRYPSGLYRASGTGALTGAATVLQRSSLGTAFAAGVPRYLLGDVITPPSTQANSTAAADSLYWRIQPVSPGESFNSPATTPVPAGTTLNYYYSPHAEKVFATQAGRVSITWVTRLPVSGSTYGFKTETFAVSGATPKPTRTLYWTERSFTGPPVNIPSGSIETVNPIYNNIVPAQVAEEYQVVGLAPNPSPNSAPPAEKRTLWFEKVGSVATLRAYNVEGRIFVEYLGALKDGSTTSREFLGADIVDIVAVAAPTNVTVSLGDLITPRDSLGRLLPTDGTAELIASPLLNTSTGGQSFYGSNARADGYVQYYAERTNDNPDQVVFYWLQRSDAAISLLTPPATPNLGINWPVQRNHYQQVWPTSPLAYQAHYTVGATGSTAATGIAFPGGQLPQIIFQDDLAQAETIIDNNTQRLTVGLSSDGINRTLLKFSGGSEVWYVRVYTQAETRPRFVTITNGGTGYTSAPTVAFTGGATGATAVATIAGGKVTGITVTNPGANFTAATGITLTGGGGNSATAAFLGLGLGFQESDGLSSLATTSEVGARINAPAGYELGGYIVSGTHYHPGAYRNPFAVGNAAAAQGAIIPVNAPPGANVLKVWWFKKVTPPSAAFQEFYTPAKIGTYTVTYPTSPQQIVLAGNAGGDLTDAEIAGSLYVQNDRTLPGFNPNEEHALLIAGRAYALRDDLNNTSATPSAYTSEPFVLVTYTSTIDQRPDIRAFKVVRESGAVVFNYPVTAGTILQGPMPLPILPLPLRADGTIANREVPSVPETTIPQGPDLYTSFTFKDRKGYDWIYRGPHDGQTAATERPPLLPALFDVPGDRGIWTANANIGSISVSEGRFSAVVNGTGDAKLIAPSLSFSGDSVPNLSLRLRASANAPVDIEWITTTAPTYSATRKFSVQYTGGGNWQTITFPMSTHAQWRGQTITGLSLDPAISVGVTFDIDYIGAATPSLGMQFYYTLRAGFFIPGLDDQPAVGTVLPYLRPLVGGAPVGDAVNGTPLTITYRPVWPQNAPELRVAESLTLPKFGLPDVFNQASAHVLYQQSVAINGAAKPSVVLHDPIREKTFALGAPGGLSSLPTSLRKTDYQGKTYFQGLPPHLQSRFFYDPLRGTKGALVLRGVFVDEPAGEDYLHLNVLSADDKTVLESLPSLTDTNRNLWISAVGALTTRVETFIPDPLKAGTYKSNSLPISVGAQSLATITDSDSAVTDYALTATGSGSGWVTMLFGNGRAFTPEGDPVALKVFRVAPQLYTGDLKVLPSSNPLDEQVTLRHSGDFAAKPDDYEFEWRYAPPQGGVAPPVYTYALTPLSAVNSGNWQFVQNPSTALPSAAEYAAVTTETATLSRTVQINNTSYTGAGALPGLVVSSVAGADFTAGIPAQIVFSASLSDLAGFVLYVNGTAALAFNAPAGFTNTSASTGLVPSEGLSRQFTVDSNSFQRGANRLEVALFSSADLGTLSAIEFRLHTSTETDQVVAGGSPWQTPNGTLLNQALVGGSPTAPLGSPLLVMSDNYFTMRYRAKASTNNVAGTTWSRWMPPKLVEGWIKRVLASINPFNQRMTDLYNNAVNTDVSLITQAGKRWEGDVALTLENINDFGLIEIYETVLNRGKNISIDSGYDYSPANDALLLAAGYLNDLYTILGNEAFADAANPTISIDDSTTVTEVNTSRFSFEGQVKSVLEEELALLRGRDDSVAPGVTVNPAYNRLYWNYTRGINSGEALYAVNYNVREKAGASTANGVVDAADAQRMFPQGHGDAYGHYLTALTGYYRLLQNPNFTWTPRSEAVTVLGQAVQIDYFDERKFAAAAANVARSATQILTLTHRQSYKDDPAAGWDQFRDGTTNSSTGLTRHWGLDEWSARTTQGAYFHWIVGNAILPDKDPAPTHTGVQIIDRTTVPGLAELTLAAETAQTTMDNANARLNPLGLSPGAIAFDISPAELKSGKSHYEQIYERSLRSVLNAKGAFDQAAKMTRLLRNQENQIESSNAAIVDQERAYVKQLTDLYGTPYPGLVGPGKIYAQDYAGPDELTWFIIDRASDLVSTTTPVTLSVRVPTNVRTFTGLAVDDITRAYSSATETTTRTIALQMNQYAQFSDVWPAGGTPLGTRSVTGALQSSLADAHQAQVALLAGYAAYRQREETFFSRNRLYQEMVKTHLDQLAEQKSAEEEISRLRLIQAALSAVAQLAKVAGDSFKDAAGSVAEFPPTVVGFANDPSSAVRGTIKVAGSTGAKIAAGVAAVATNSAKYLQAQQDGRQKEADQIVAELGFTYQQAQVAYEYEVLYRELVQSHFEIAQLATNLQRSLQRVNNLMAEGERLKAEREIFRQRAAGLIQGYRTRDLTFRTFRNEGLEQYRSLFDLASRYTYLAAKSYDYETGLLGSAAGQSVINGIVAARSLGDLTNGTPQATVSTLGDAGLAGTMARMQADWSVAKGRLGINNPDTNGTLFSLRRELFRILDNPAITDDDAAWQQTLEQHIVSNLLADPDIAAQCRNLRNADGSAVPGIVIPFTTTVQDHLNFFGLPLAVGDHAFTPTNFATKIYSTGVVFRGYIGLDPYVAGTPNATGPALTSPNALSAAPYVYLIPTGTDYLRAPAFGDTGAIRGWDVKDQALPLPFNLGATSFSSTQFFNANGTLSEQPWILRKHQSFRPVNDPVFFYGSVPAEFTNSRLVGRSVWNSGWKLVIPAKTLLNNEQDGLNRFVASVKDIELFLRTYSHSGN
jgi:hypothetical protein